MTVVRLAVSPDPRVLAAELGIAAAELKDWRPVWAGFLPTLAAGEAAELEHMGTTAIPNAPAYREQKRGGAVGYLTGKSFQTIGDPLGSKHSMSKSTLRWGPGLKWIYVLHYGVVATKGRKERRALRRSRLGTKGATALGLRFRQVPRPFLGWTPTLELALGTAMQQRVERLLDEATSNATGSEVRT